MLKAINEDHWQPVRLSKNGFVVSHIFFADDVLLFAKASASQATLILDILTRFETSYGLKINASKSKVFLSSAVKRSKMDQIVSNTGIRRSTSLEKYLGFPMLHGRVQRREYDFLVEKINTRLASWKNKLQNKVGRLTMVKSVLSSIPTYYMHVAWLPQTICNQIDKRVNGICIDGMWSFN